MVTHPPLPHSYCMTTYTLLWSLVRNRRGSGKTWRLIVSGWPHTHTPIQCTEMVHTIMFTQKKVRIHMHIQTCTASLFRSFRCFVHIESAPDLILGHINCCKLSSFRFRSTIFFHGHVHNKCDTAKMLTSSFMHVLHDTSKASNPSCSDFCTPSYTVKCNGERTIRNRLHNGFPAVRWSPFHAHIRTRMHLIITYMN